MIYRSRSINSGHSLTLIDEPRARTYPSAEFPERTAARKQQGYVSSPFSLVPPPESSAMHSSQSGRSAKLQSLYPTPKSITARQILRTTTTLARNCTNNQPRHCRARKNRAYYILAQVKHTQHHPPAQVASKYLYNSTARLQVQHLCSPEGRARYRRT